MSSALDFAPDVPQDTNESTAHNCEQCSLNDLAH